MEEEDHDRKSGSGTWSRSIAASFANGGFPSSTNEEASSRWYYCFKCKQHGHLMSNCETSTRQNQNGDKRTDGGDSWYRILFPQRQLKYKLITQEQYNEALQSGLWLRVPTDKADLNDDPPTSEAATDNAVVSRQRVINNDLNNTGNIPAWKNIREVTAVVKTNVLLHLKSMKPSPLQWAILHEFAKGTDIYLRSGGSFNPDISLVPLMSKLAAENAGWPENRGPVRDCFEPKALVLAPSVKRCVQMYAAARKFAHGTGLRIRYSNGQQGVDRDFAQLGDGCDLLCTTVQRVALMIYIGAVSLHRVSYLLVAQVHELLSDEGLLEQLQEVLADSDFPLTARRQTVFVTSRTPPLRISDIARAHMKGSHKTLTDDTTE